MKEGILNKRKFPLNTDKLTFSYNKITSVLSHPNPTSLYYSIKLIFHQRNTVANLQLRDGR